MAQLKDLLVSGAARFLNNIYGNLIGNSTSSDKVNHKFTVLGVDFDGSADKTVDASNIKTALGLNRIDDSLKLIGIIDTRATVLSEDSLNSDTNAATGMHVIFFQKGKVFSASKTKGSGTVNVNGTNIEVEYCTPEVGDVVLQNEMEYICISVEKSGNKIVGSRWVALDTSGYWYTW